MKTDELINSLRTSKGKCILADKGDEHIEKLADLGEGANIKVLTPTTRAALQLYTVEENEGKIIAKIHDNWAGTKEEFDEFAESVREHDYAIFLIGG